MGKKPSFIESWTFEINKMTNTIHSFGDRTTTGLRTLIVYVVLFISVLMFHYLGMVWFKRIIIVMLVAKTFSDVIQLIKMAVVKCKKK